MSLVRAAERVTDRISRLQLEAKALAAENTAGLAADLYGMAARALELAEGGDAYPPGVRDLAARVAASLAMNAKSIQTIQRQAAPRTGSSSGG